MVNVRLSSTNRNAGTRRWAREKAFFYFPRHGHEPPAHTAAAAYQTSKFGLVGLSAALRAEYGSSSFGVTALCPGFVHTPLVDELDTSDAEKLPPEWMFTDADTVAGAAIQGIRRDKGIVVVTLVTRALWLLARLSPAFVDWLNRRGAQGSSPSSMPRS
jgi:short-subunit dehydrogenase